MKPEESTNALVERASTYEPVSDQPTNLNLVDIHEAFVQILFRIPNDKEKGSHSLIGLIQSPSPYKTEYGADFPRPKNPGIYSTKIPDDAKDGFHA